MTTARPSRRRPEGPRDAALKPGPRAADPDLLYGNGCDYHPDCFTCPLPMCRYETRAAGTGGPQYLHHRQQVQALTAQGLTVRHIAETLGISMRTVARHRAGLPPRADKRFPRERAPAVPTRDGSAALAGLGQAALLIPPPPASSSMLPASRPGRQPGPPAAPAAPRPAPAAPRGSVGLPDDAPLPASPFPIPSSSLPFRLISNP